jgi:hypothetical protein
VLDLGLEQGDHFAARAYAFATTSPTSTLSKVIKSPGG